MKGVLYVSTRGGILPEHRSVLALCLTLAGARLATGTALAADQHGGKGAMMHGRGGGMMNWAAALNLTPDQVSKARKIKLDGMKQMIQTQADLHRPSPPGSP